MHRQAYCCRLLRLAGKDVGPASRLLGEAAGAAGTLPEAGNGRGAKSLGRRLLVKAVD